MWWFQQALTCAWFRGSLLRACLETLPLSCCSPAPFSGALVSTWCGSTLSSCPWSRLPGPARPQPSGWPEAWSALSMFPESLPGQPFLSGPHRAHSSSPSCVLTSIPASSRQQLLTTQPSPACQGLACASAGGQRLQPLALYFTRFAGDGGPGPRQVCRWWWW